MEEGIDMIRALQDIAENTKNINNSLEKIFDFLQRGTLEVYDNSREAVQ